MIRACASSVMVVVRFVVDAEQLALLCLVAFTQALASALVVNRSRINQWVGGFFARTVTTRRRWAWW
jgi:hypothetical protein